MRINKTAGTVPDGLTTAFEPDDMVLLWLYRLLVPLGAHKILLREKDFRDDQLADGIGFGHYIFGDAPKDYDQPTIRKEMFAVWEKLETVYTSFVHKDEEMRKNAEALCASLGLNIVEADILHFSVMAKINPLLEVAIAMNGIQTARSLERLFSVCLGLPEANVRNALLPSGALSMSGLLWLDTNGNYDFSNKVELLKGLVDELHIHHDDPANIFRNIICKSYGPKLSQADYPQLAQEISLLRRYLASVISKNLKGVNVLLHGEPGTGKTEFARMLAFECGIELYEVSTGDRLDRPMEPMERLRAYWLGQTLCKRKSYTAILFDEVEDVFCVNRPSPRDEGNRSGKKGWFNHVLENNPVPAIWVTNFIGDLDPAYLRRFDFVLEINVPPQSVREKILSSYLADLPVSAVWKKQMAEHQALVPAIVERAAKVVRAIGQPYGEEHTEQSLEKVIGNTLEAMGYRRPKMPGSLPITRYRLDVLNTDQDVASLCNGLAQHRQARICLFGPPGTGKTAFGRHVAELLDMPLLAKRASDIIEPYVGMTERNMARIFRQAREENAVLMLDEADTFLQDRQNAHHSWEISAVNEMLTQMESYGGVFIASTNFMTALDNASFRRFDVKLKFDFLRPEQAWTMFLDLAQECGMTSCEHVRKRIQKLNALTPGDFAAVSRRLRLVIADSPDDLVAMIESECYAKPDGRQRTIGF